MTDTSTPIPAAQLREWREACERATPGEWWIDERDGTINRVTSVFADNGECVCDNEPYYPQAVKVEDMRFIAIARTALPRLLDAYDSAQREIAALRELEVAATRLCNEVRACLGMSEGEIRYAIGNTNYTCLETRERECRELLNALRERTAELDARDAQGSESA